jgi:hypothetical protein
MGIPKAANHVLNCLFFTHFLLAATWEQKTIAQFTPSVEFEVDKRGPDCTGRVLYFRMGDVTSAGPCTTKYSLLFFL